MSDPLDLGALVGRVVLEDVVFQQTYVRVVRQMADLGSTAAKSTAGTDGLSDSLGAVGESAGTAAVGMDRATKSATATASAEAKAAAAAERNAQAVAAVARVTKTYADSSDQVRAAALRQAAAQARLDDLNATGTATTKQLAAANASLISATRSLSTAQLAEADTSETARAALSGFLKTAGELGLIVGVFEGVKQGIDITKDAVTYQQWMTRIKTETGASTAEVNQMGAALLKLAGPLATSPIDLAKSLYLVESAGYRGAAALDIVTNAAKLAKIGNSDLTDTTDALVGVLQTGLTGGAKNAAGTVALLNATVGAGKLTMQGLVDALGTGIAASAKTFGVSGQSIGAALALMTDEGTPPTQAATRLRMAMTLLAAPTKQAAEYLTDAGLSSADAGKQISATQVLLQKAGVTTTELAADLRKPDGFLVAMQDLKSHMEAAGLTADEQAALISRAFGGGRTAQPILQMLANLGLLQQKYVQIGDGVSKFGDDWTTTQQTASFALKRVEGDAEAWGISMATKLLPTITSVSHWLGTDLPHDIDTLQATLLPLEREVGGAFVTAWHAAGDVLGVVGGVLGDVGHFLAENHTLVTGLVTPILAMWAAWKGYTIARTAALAIGAAIEGVGQKALGGAVTIATYGRGVQATFAGNATAAEKSVLQQKASFAQLQAAQAQAAADQAAEAAVVDESLTGEAIVAQETADAMALAATEAADAVVAAGDIAATGWKAIAGPAGLVVVGITAAATAFGLFGSSAKAQIKPTQDLTDAIKADGDAIGAQTKAIINQKLEADGLYTAGLKLGLSTQTVLNAALGVPGAMAHVKTAVAGVNNEYNNAPAAGYSLAMDDNKNAADKLSTGLTGVTKTLAVNKKAAENETSATKDNTSAKTKNAAANAAASTATAALAAEQKWLSQVFGVSTDTLSSWAAMLGVSATAPLNDYTAAVLEMGRAEDDGTQSGAAFIAALNTFSTSAGTAADRAALIGATLVAANGDALNYAAGMNAAASAAATFGKDVASNATTAAHATKDSAAENRKYLRSIIDLKTGTIDYSKSAAGPLISDLQSMQTAAMNAAQATYQHEVATKGATAAAQDAYNVYHAQTAGQLVAEAKALGLTKTQAQALATQYFGMPKSVKTLIEAEGTNPIVTVLDKIGTQLAFLTGQPWNVPVTVTTTVLDPVTAKTAPSIGHRSTGSGSGVTTDSASETPLTTNAAPDPIGDFNGGVAAKAAKSASKSVKVTVGGITYSSPTAAGNAQVRAVRTVVNDAAKFMASLSKSTSDISTAATTLLTAAKTAGLSGAALAAAEKIRTQVIADANARDKIQTALTAEDNKLKADQKSRADEINTVKSAALGSFDITTAGADPVTGAITGAGELAQGAQAANNARTWAADLIKLHAEKLNNAFYQQLAEGGPADLPEVQALMSLNLGQIGQLNADQTAIGKAGTSVGTSLANSLFNGTIALDDATIAKLTKALHAEQIIIEIDGKNILYAVKTAEKKAAR